MTNWCVSNDEVMLQKNVALENETNSDNAVATSSGSVVAHGRQSTGLVSSAWITWHSQGNYVPNANGTAVARQSLANQQQEQVRTCASWNGRGSPPSATTCRAGSCSREQLSIDHRVGVEQT